MLPSGSPGVTIYTAKYLVSRSGSVSVGGALLVDQGRILRVDSVARLVAEAPSAEIRDYGHAVILPGFVNVHTHLELSLFGDWTRSHNVSFSAGDSFVDWMIKLVRIKRQLEPRQISAAIEHGMALSVKSGTLLVGDVLSYLDQRSHYRQGPLEGICYLETLGRNPQLTAKAAKRMQEELAQGDSGPFTTGVSPHSPYTISADYLAHNFSWCRHQRLKCTTHIAEAGCEVDFVRDGAGELIDKLYPFVGWNDFIPKGTGLSPVAYLDKQGGLFPDNLLVHGVQLSDADIELLADRRMALALCPRSNQLLKVGKAPVEKLRKAGVKLVLGTDGLSSNSSLSIWDEMAFAHRWFDGQLDPLTLFSMATQEGADILGYGQQFGSLDEGKAASFQVVNLPQGVAANELFDYFVDPGCDKPIEQVYHRGLALLPPVGRERQ